MGKYTIIVKSFEDGVNNFHTNFNITFGSVLPTDINYFKCRVSTLILGSNPATAIHDMNGNTVRAFQLVANFPFVNQYVTDYKNIPIALLHTLNRFTTEQHEFTINNISHQTINFKVLFWLVFQ